MSSSDGDDRKPIKVLVVIDHLGGGGAQEYVYQLAQHLDRDRVRLTVVALHSWGVYHERLHAVGVQTYSMVARHTVLSRSLMLTRLHAFLRKNTFDVINTFLEGALIIATPLARRHKCPTVHNIVAAPEQLPKRYHRFLGRYSKWFTACINPYGPEAYPQVSAVPLVYDFELPMDLSPCLALKHNPGLVLPGVDVDAGTAVLLSVGRLHPDKGHQHAIEAMRWVSETVPEATLLILGEGRHRQSLEQLCQDLELTKWVRFLGYRDDLLSLLSRSNIFLFASLNEGINLTGVQALAGGVPVIGFDNGGPNPIIADGENGTLVKSGDSEALGRAAVALLKDDETCQRLSEAGRATMIKRFDLNALVVAHEDMYLAVAGSAAEPPAMSKE